jgi:hypothetical protein
LLKHRLRFHKRSVDGSAKCNALNTEASTDAVFGAVFEISPDEKTALDRAEGLGLGYHEECHSVLLHDGQELKVRTYIADPAAIDDNLKPYSWYKEFVLAGAEELQLPSDYIDRYVRTVAAETDTNPKREKDRRTEIRL